jgi:hypothetical protein
LADRATRFSVASERVERKLAAILAADVVGHNRLSSADEEGTIGARPGPAA